MPEASDRPLVEVELVSDRIAIATLRGEHDLSTADQVASALTRACEKPTVVVDLSECAFIDSTVLRHVLSAHRRQVERGGRLELVIPTNPAGVVHRLVTLSRVDELLFIHETLEDALARVEAEG